MVWSLVVATRFRFGFSDSYIDWSGKSQNLPCNPGAGFGIGEGVVVVEFVVSTGLGYGVELVVR